MTMQYVTFKVPEKMYDLMQQLVEEEHYMNRSDLVRAAIRALLKEEGVWLPRPPNLKTGMIEP